MSSTPWKSDMWFTSPWNFADEVKETWNFAKKIKIHDVSLRDGEQQAGLIFNKEMKIQLADKMAEMGIHRIEAGMPAVSPQDEAAIKYLAKKYQGPDDPEIFAFCRCMKPDVLRAVDCGVKGIVIEIPSSEHMVQNAYKWEMERAIDLSIEATLCAKEHGLYTVFFPIDGSRAEINWFLKLIKTVETQGHMDALAVVDTLGGLAPSSIPYLIKKIKSVIDKPLETHFHDDFGMGAANTVLGLAAGAEVAHTTISSIGERAGNAGYEDVVVTLLTMYGVDVGLDYSKIYGLSQLLQQLSGLKVQQNRGIVGEDIAKMESGIIVDWYVNAIKDHPLELSPYRYPLTGHPDWEVVLGKNSGLPSVDVALGLVGLACEDRDLKMKMVTGIKEKAFEKMGLLTLEEFEVIAKDVMGLK